LGFNSPTLHLLLIAFFGATALAASGLPLQTKRARMKKKNNRSVSLNSHTPLSSFIHAILAIKVSAAAGCLSI